MSASITVSLDRNLLRGAPITVRVQTSDLAVIAEGPPGLPLDIPTEGSFFATAIDTSGRQVSDALKIDMAQDIPLLDVTLKVKATDEPTRALQLEADQDAGLKAVDDDGTLSPPFRFVYVLRKPPPEVSDEPNRLDSLLSVHILDANEDANSFPPSEISALGILFSGPRGKRLSVCPADLHRGKRVSVPPFHWSPASTPGYSFPSYDFEDTAVNELVTSLRRQTTNSRLVSLPFEPSLAGVLRALVAMRDPRQWERLNEEMHRWDSSLRWSPDACIIRAEILARLGKHAEARETLSLLSQYSLPWTRLALISVAERIDFYDQRADSSKRSAFRSRWYRDLLSKCHPASTFCVFELSPEPTFLKTEVLNRPEF